MKNIPDWIIYLIFVLIVAPLLVWFLNNLKEEPTHCQSTDEECYQETSDH